MFKKKQELKTQDLNGYYLFYLDKVWSGPHKNPEDVLSDAHVHGYVVKIELIGEIQEYMKYVPIKKESE